MRSCAHQSSGIRRARQIGGRMASP
jgi:hypothetical protein